MKRDGTQMQHMNPVAGRGIISGMRAVWVILVAVVLSGSLPALAAGTVVGWGENSYGQCDTPETVGGFGEVTALAGGRYHSMALQADGTVVTWGGGWGADTNEFPEGLSGVSAIAAGNDHNLALQADGTVVAWGSDNYLQCYAVDGISNVTAIAAGGDNSVVLQADGTVVARGQYVNYSVNVYATNTVEVIALASGPWHDFGLRSDGTLVDLRGGYVPDGLTGITAVAAGSIHGLALQSNGTVVSWNDSVPVPEGLTNVIAIAAKGSHNMALQSDGTIVTWGGGGYGENEIPEGLSQTAVIGAGVYHSLALGAYGTAPSPMLQITGAVSQVVVSWEPDSPGFILQQADSLSSNTFWSDAPGGSSNPVALPAVQPRAYFRLHKP